MEVHPEVQGAGADHPTNAAGLHGGFDRFPLAAINGAVVQGQSLFHFRAGEAQTLVPTLRLIAGVGEQQGADAGIEAGHQLLVHPQPEVSGPGEAIDRLRKDALNLRAAGRSAPDQLWLTCRSQGMARCLLEVADGGTDGPGLELGAQLAQPAQAQLRLAAPFAAHQLVPFIEDHRFELAKQLFGLGVAQQQGEGLRSRHQNLWWCLELFGAFAAAAVAIADAHPNRPAHRLDRFADRQRQVAAEGPQGRDVEQSYSLQRLLLRQHPRDRSHHGGEGFARPCGHLDQAIPPRQIGAPGLLLKRQRCPVPLREPVMNRLQARVVG